MVQGTNTMERIPSYEAKNYTDIRDIPGPLWKLHVY